MTAVVVLTNTLDGENTARVINHLHDIGSDVIRMDVDTISRGEHSLSIGYCDDRTKVIYNGNAIEGINSIWFRRPYLFDFNISDKQQYLIAEEEFRDTLSGLWLIWQELKWVNNPNAINTARVKPYQLKVASDIGLLIPQTVITNDVSEAEQFCDAHEAVFKPMSGYSLEYQDKIHTAYTTKVTKEIRENLSLVRNQHVMLQKYIRKTREIRVTCVGNDIFATSITCEDFEEVIDQRTPGNYERLSYEPWRLPVEIQNKIRLLLGKLGLTYAAIDLAINSDGEYIFFEVNPIGQWLWIEEITGQPITKCLAEHLAT